jgi:hypothetical protein
MQRRRKHAFHGWIVPRILIKAENQTLVAKPAQSCAQRATAADGAAHDEVPSERRIDLGIFQLPSSGTGFGDGKAFAQALLAGSERG